MRLLLAEDELAMAEAVADILTYHQYSVDTALRGDDALRMIQAGGYDGVILDVMMPGMDGLQVLARMRDQGMRTPVLMLTAKGEVEDKVKGFEMGADDYLVKPFAQQEVDNALDWCMEEQRENWRTLTLLSEWEPVEVRLRQIDYIEIKGHTAHIHMNSGRVIQVRKGLDALEAEIDSGDFLRCHRSFLVNMASIQRVDRTDFVLAGDVRVPIGSQNGARARQCFTQWVMDHTWR